MVRPTRDNDDRNLIPVRDFDYLILAVPPGWLAFLAMGPYSTPKTAPQHHLVDLIPQLAQLRRVRSEPVPVLNLTFKRRLDNITREYVALLGSPFFLTYTEIDPIVAGCTTLAVAASDFYSLPASVRRKSIGILSVESVDGYVIAKELSQYLRFDPGMFWLDQNCDVDYDRSKFIDGTEQELHVDEVGSEVWCIEPAYSEVSNVFFAGDFCKSSVSVTTLEAATISGLNAAAALQDRAHFGAKIKIIEPDQYPTRAILALKLLMTPSAYFAKLWSMMLDVIDRSQSRGAPAHNRFDLIDLMLTPYLVGAGAWFDFWDRFGKAVNRELEK